MHIIVEAYLFLFSSPSFPPLLCFSFDDCFFRVGFGMYKNGIWVLGFFSKMYMFIYILMGDVGYSPSYPSYHKPPHVLNCLKDLRGKASIVLKYAVSFRSYAMLCYAMLCSLSSEATYNPLKVQISFLLLARGFVFHGARRKVTSAGTDAG